MANRSPARRYLPMRVTPTTYALLSELAERETGGNVSRMVRKLVREALVTRRAVTQAGQPQNRRVARTTMDSTSDPGWSGGHSPHSTSHSTGERDSSSADAVSPSPAGRGVPEASRGAPGCPGASLGGHAGSVRSVGAVLAASAMEGCPPTIPSGYRLPDVL